VLFLKVRYNLAQLDYFSISMKCPVHEFLSDIMESYEMVDLMLQGGASVCWNLLFC